MTYVEFEGDRRKEEHWSFLPEKPASAIKGRKFRGLDQLHTRRYSGVHKAGQGTKKKVHWSKKYEKERIIDDGKKSA